MESNQITLRYVAGSAPPSLENTLNRMSTRKRQSLAGELKGLGATATKEVVVSLHACKQGFNVDVEANRLGRLDNLKDEVIRACAGYLCMYISC